MSAGIKAIVAINQAASNFKSSIVLRMNDKYVDVKSILGLSISLYTNEEYKLEIHGPDEVDAKIAMAEVFKKYHLQVFVI